MRTVAKRQTAQLPRTRRRPYRASSRLRARTAERPLERTIGRDAARAAKGVNHT